MFILDTDVLADGSPVHKLPRSDLKLWLQKTGENVYLTTTTVLEIWRGIELLQLKGATRKAGLLAQWAQALEVTFGDRILALDAQSARHAGILLARAEASGHSPGMADASIAALADLKGYTVITYNQRHFRALGVTTAIPGNKIQE